MSYHLPKPDYQFYTKDGTIEEGTLHKYKKNDLIGWRLKFTADSDFPSSWRDLWLSEEVPKMYKHNSDINIMLSGGSDSIITSLGFLECGYDVNHTIILWKDYDHITNAREVKEAFKFAGKHRIKYDVVEHNIKDFIDEWITDPVWQGYSTNIMDQSLQMWGVSKIDPSLFTIVSEPGFPDYPRHEDGTFGFRTDLDNCQTQEIWRRFKFNGTCRPWFTSPKATAAFFAGDVAEKIIYDNILNLPVGASTYFPEFKYKAWGLMSGFNIEQYEVPKTSVQMFEKHKWLKKWHKAMAAGLLNLSNISLLLKYSANDFQDRIRNNTISDYWIDSSDWYHPPRTNTWHGGKVPE